LQLVVGMAAVHDAREAVAGALVAVKSLTASVFVPVVGARQRPTASR
jgi:hypothetical protein